MSRSTCKHKNCDRPRRYAGLCASHHWRKANGKDMDAPFRPYHFRAEGERRPCNVVGCRGQEDRARGLCQTHYRRKQAGDPNWSRHIRRHRPLGETHDVLIRLPKPVVAKLKARAAARGMSMAEVARGILEVSA